MYDRQQAMQRHGAGLADHILLGNAALDEAIGEAVAKWNESGVQNKVAVESDNSIIAASLCHESLAVGGDHPLGSAGRRRKRADLVIEFKRFRSCNIERPVCPQDEFVGSLRIIFRRRSAGMKGV